MKDREEIVSAFKQCGLPGACLKCKYGAEKEGCYAALKHDVLELLKEQPEVVRCKNCKYWQPNTEFCGRWTFGFIAHRTPPEWFCGDGEVKKDET